jgi:chemotaxis methyl-accepting protein methylase
MQSLKEVRLFIDLEALRLDPGSRYITELLEIVGRSADVADLEHRLDASSRGRHWAGAQAFDKMTLAEKLRCNLVTNETSLMRFDERELRFMRRILQEMASKPDVRLLSLPCSHGEEAFSLAIECIEAGMKDFVVHGLDIQPACIEMARSGVIPFPGLPRRVRCVVDPDVVARTTFGVADVFTDDIGGGYDIIVCRNFLGYFSPDAIASVLKKLANALTFERTGWLLVDQFVLDKHREAFYNLPLAQITGLPVFTVDLD